MNKDQSAIRPPAFSFAFPIRHTLCDEFSQVGGNLIQLERDRALLEAHQTSQEDAK